MQTICPTFLVRKVYDVKPIPGASFWSDLPASLASDDSKSTSKKGKESARSGLGGWENLRQKGVKGWNAKTDAIQKTKGWDVEPEMEIESEDDVILVRRKKVEKKKKEKREMKRKESQSKPEEAEVKVYKEAVSESESDGEDDDEGGENFVSFDMCFSCTRSVQCSRLSDRSSETR
jgi:hypothetical protein